MVVSAAVLVVIAVALIVLALSAVFLMYTFDSEKKNK